MINNTTKQILSLDQKSTKELNEMYVKLYCEAPNVRSKSQLIRKIAYKLQELEYGFLPDKYVKKLEFYANQMSKGKSFCKMEQFKPINGTRICKEYKGITYEVETVQEGFLCNGFVYKSLSALATKITGNRTNGPLFFKARR
jgi:hypothetical protein